MQIQSNYHNFTNSNQRKNVPEFKGEVSPSFIQYVNILKNDCMETVCRKNGITLAEYQSNNLSIPGITWINNICNGIIDRAIIIMEKCFPPESELSVDTTTIDVADALCISYSLIDGCKHNTGFITKEYSPIYKLNHLRQWIRGEGNCFEDAYGKDAKFISSQLYCKLKHKFEYNNCHQIDKEFFIKALNLLKFYQEHIDICVSEGILKNRDREHKNFDRDINSVAQYLESLENNLQQQ